jgi:hypothetical protein
MFKSQRSYSDLFVFVHFRTGYRLDLDKGPHPNSQCPYSEEFAFAPLPTFNEVPMTMRRSTSSRSWYNKLSKSSASCSPKNVMSG